ncbi:aqualysin-1-like [Ptychodera flava]|uniref:aqualysin-1-like n=1 Tax=Ptychodera flava TaxID=63121 RepID=UPI00396A08F2
MRCLVFAALIAAASAVYMAPYAPTRGGDALKHSYILHLKDGVDARAFGNKRKALDNLDVKYIYTRALNGLAIETMDLMSIRGFDEIELIEDNMLAKAVVEWGMDRTDQRNLPLDGQMNLYGSGAGTHIYIVDTGLRYTHTEINGRTAFLWDWESGGNGNDCDGHGTHCAGTAGGRTVGIAPSSTIWNVRVLDCQGSGYISDIIMGLEEIIANGQNPALSVVSMSIGSGPNNAFDNAVRNTIAAGYTSIIAAGNSGRRACLESPARVEEGITVGATDITDTRVGWSNWGSCVDIFAPGVDVRSAVHTCDTCYESWSGTSMATPHVSGVAAVHLGAGNCDDNNSCKTRIINDATSGVVSNPGNGSPNLLLYCD